MRHFFVDTFYLIALSNRRDQWHRRVVTFSRALRDVRLYTVDEVLAEFLTFSSPLGAHIRSQAAHTVKYCRPVGDGSKLLTHAAGQVYGTRHERYRRRRAQGWHA